jgi:hypothetical protein
MSMKKSSDAIGNRTRDLLACSTVLQPTASPRAPFSIEGFQNFLPVMSFVVTFYSLILILFTQ